ncbi:MAG: hypothetical protein ABID71_01525 [Chloroflexota bacterium]
MGSRDFRHREQKKVKKDPKKLPTVNVLKPPVNVEVIKKGKKREEEEA